MRRTAARVIARLNAGRNKTRTVAANGDAADGGDKDDEHGDDQPPRIGRGPLKAQRCCHGGTQHEPCQPAGGGQRHDGDLDQGLGEAGAEADLGDLAHGDVSSRGARFGSRNELGQRAQARVVVEVAHGHGGVALPDMAHEGRGRQRGAAEREKVGVLVFHGHAERFYPQLREPLLGLGQRGRFHAHSRQRPRQGLLINLAGGAHRQFFHHADARDERGRHGFGQAGVRGLVIEALGLIFEGNIAHQDGLAARSLLHGHGRVIDVIQGRDVSFDFAELDAAPANFHLVIHAADEVQPVFFQAHVVTGAIRTLPAHRLQRGVLLRVLSRIQVGRQSHAADHQLADAA